MEPITIDEVKNIVKADLERCDPQQTQIFKQYSVEPYFAPIRRHEKLEKVVVVARKSDEVIYWEDAEEGFNLSPVGSDGLVLEHWCNQDDLGIALNNWIDGRGGYGKFRPAQPLDF